MAAWNLKITNGFATAGVAGLALCGGCLRGPSGVAQLPAPQVVIQPVTVTLTNLPPHRAISLSFLFAAIDSLDGAAYLAITGFTQFIAPTLVTSNEAPIREFHREHRDIILKPLDGMGGMGIFRVRSDGLNLGGIIETLNQGGAIPQLGYGVWKIGDDEAASCVTTAIEAGYRSIDTAMIYRNEVGVGRAVAHCILHIALGLARRARERKVDVDKIFGERLQRAFSFF